MSERRDEPKVKLTSLYLQKSQAGTEYFSGTMGPVRILGFKSKFTGRGGEERWDLFVLQREQRPDGSVQKPDDSDF